MADRFAAGMLVSTAAVAEETAGNHDFAHHVAACVKRHLQGDWGDVPPDDALSNDLALSGAGGRLHSSYEHPDHPRIWIITEHDRSVTTILFPSDY